MRRLATWLSGFAGGVALYRFFSRRQPASVALPPVPAVEDEGPDPRAQELRAKLEESRVLVDEREEFEAAETPVDRQAEPPPRESPDERRKHVHEQGRAAATRMRRQSDA